MTASPKRSTPHQSQSKNSWTQYGKSAGGGRFVTASQITPQNVSNLKMVWEFHTHDLSDGNNKPFSAFECTPTFVDDTLYIVSPFNRVFALNPDTGKLKWTYDPKIDKFKPVAEEPFACRGVTAWQNPQTGKVTIFLATYDARLIALSAKTGTPIISFGNKGTVDLKDGVGTRYLNHYHETSAPCVVGGLVIVGSSILDNLAVDMPSGVVRAYYANSGKLAWRWNPLANLPSLPTVSNPKVAKYLRGAKTGSGNAWATISADSKRGLVFVPTGSASPDFFGGYRPGNDADADSVVCLNAKTGHKKWAFQTVHHDLWDYDVPSEPIICIVAGKPAVVVTTKMGFVFVLNELSGKPMLPIKERKVPINGIKGEYYSPTQPFPILPKPLVPITFQPWAINDSFKQFIRNKTKGKRSGGIFTPVGFNGTIVLPGGLGGCNWSGASYDPLTNTLFVNTNSIANIVTIVKRGDEDNFNSILMQKGAPYAVDLETFDAPDQVPANAPPWGVMHAINLTDGKVEWERPLGQMPQFSSFEESKAWGAPNLGGSFCTSNGLVFIAATVNPVLRAFDSATGKILWRTSLPAGGQATPMEFVSPRTGREIIVQCAGGHHGLGSIQGDSVIAYALPQARPIKKSVLKSSISVP